MPRVKEFKLENPPNLGLHKLSDVLFLINKVRINYYCNTYMSHHPVHTSPKCNTQWLLIWVLLLTQLRGRTIPSPTGYCEGASYAGLYQPTGEQVLVPGVPVPRHATRGERYHQSQSHRMCHEGGLRPAGQWCALNRNETIIDSKRDEERC